MKNRHWLNSISEYDALCRMNAHLRTNTSHYLGGWTSPCIMTALKSWHTTERSKRCLKYQADCGKCIADWLNEEA